MKDAHLNFILLFQKCYQSLKCSKSFKLFFKKIFLYIASFFTNKKNKIVKSTKFGIGIFISSKISIYSKFGDCDMYSRFLMQLLCHFCFYIYIAERKFVVRGSKNYFNGYFAKFFNRSHIQIGKIAMSDKQIGCRF